MVYFGFPLHIASVHFLYSRLSFFFCGKINKLNGSFRLSKQGLIVTPHSKKKINKKNKLYKRHKKVGHNKAYSKNI